MFDSMFDFGNLPYVNIMTDQEAIDTIDQLKSRYAHMSPYDLEEHLECAGIDSSMLSPHVQDIVNLGW